MRRRIIAIDGPSGAGKGTIARAIADALGYRHLDTGAMYRAVAWKALRNGLSLDDEAGVTDLVLDTRIGAVDGVVTVDAEDVTRAIRTPDIDRAAAAVARLPRVREVLVARQRLDGESGGIVVEGRDIGTVVFPDAAVKLYLDASPEERARRRAADPAHASSRSAELAQIASEMATRDRADRTRTASPLQMAPDAYLIDTSGKPVDVVVAEVLEVIRKRGVADP
jgi:cytidylate kinase